MKATEQISAMEMMAVDPIARVVAPRFWGGVISMPLLAALFSAAGIFGGYLVGVQLIGVDAGAFWSQMQAAVDVREDILNGVIKSVVFGVAVTWISVFEGYDASRPPKACRAPPRAPWSPRRSRSWRSTSCSPRSCSPEATTNHEPLDDRSVGRNLRRRRFRRAALPRAQGGQPRHLLHQRHLPGAGQVRQHRRPKVRGPVKSAGVVVGRVADIRFDNESYEAIVSMTIDAGYQFRATPPRRSSLRDFGEQYIGLEAGGDGVMLKNGDRLRPHAVGGGAGEPHQPVPVQQGRRGQASGEVSKMRNAEWDGVAAPAARAGCATVEGERDPRDPWEGFNRGVYRFNETFDEYRAAGGARVRGGPAPGDPHPRRNFFSNIQDLLIGANNFLQGKFEDGVNDWARFAFNSTIGLLGSTRRATSRGWKSTTRTSARPSAAGAPARTVPHPAVPRLEHGARRGGHRSRLGSSQAKCGPSRCATRSTACTSSTRAQLLDASRILEERRSTNTCSSAMLICNGGAA